MKKDIISRALEGVKDEYIAEAAQYRAPEIPAEPVCTPARFKKTRFARRAAVAACLAAAVALGAAGAMLLRDPAAPPEISSPAQSGSDAVVESGTDDATAGDGELSEPSYETDESDPGETNDFAPYLYVEQMLSGTDVVKMEKPDDLSVTYVTPAERRPNGYDSNIGDVLALKMEYGNDRNEKFSTLISYDGGKGNIINVISAVNSKLSDAIDTSELKGIETEIQYSQETVLVDSSRLGFFTKEQIAKLAENGVECLYVGSGVGNASLIQNWWESREGINAYCELIGDNYTVKDGVIVYRTIVFIKGSD